MTAQQIAHSLLSERGMTGDLLPVAGNWQLRGIRGTQGCAVEIEGEPDEATLTDAANIIACELARPI